MKKFFLVTFISFLFVAGVIFIYIQNKPRTSLIPVTIRLKWLNQAQFAGIYVAKEKGIYKKYGLDVTILERDPNGISSVQEVLQDKVDFSIISPQELLTTVQGGKPIKGLMVTYQKTPSALASLKEKNIKSPLDLKNKTLGTVGTLPVGKLLYKGFFHDFQIDEKTVTYKDVGFNQIDNLVQKKVDVVSLYRNSDLYKLIKANVPYNLILPEDYGQNLYDDVLITTNKNLSENYNLVTNFVKATLEGWEYAINNPNYAIDLSYQYANYQYKDKNYQEFVFNQGLPLIRSNGGQKVGEMNYDRWNYIYRLLRQNNIVQEFDFTKAYVILPL